MQQFHTDSLICATASVEARHAEEAHRLIAEVGIEGLCSHLQEVAMAMIDTVARLDLHSQPQLTTGQVDIPSWFDSKVVHEEPWQ
jgi:hypothetical protein